ncbi:DUF885 domain-containing protein [Rhodospirillum centenum]|uniref:DUF885 domain-containing protein n=1 Tax=Rhodospirillum centenum (strain ATCC 51521 / SW) TaxID=414684 RepID=B6ITR5_RHOCS|nr:DUF885 domain-containing protein [Rhodospirillum centenum]ACI99366.1 conserved hypothetical protein [Rhodospirillum centenum SW]
MRATMRVGRRDFLAMAAAGAVAGPLLLRGGMAVAADGKAAPGPTAGADGAGTALNTFLEAAFDAEVAASPERETALGYRYDNGAWSDDSEDGRRREHERRQAELARLRAEFDPARLSEQDRLSYRLFEYEAEADAEAYGWRLNSYAVSHIGGRHTGIPGFLINEHHIRTEADAAAYVARVRAVKELLAVTAENVRIRADRGVLPPRFSLAKAAADARRVLAGAPFAGEGENLLLLDFRGKLGEAGLPEARSAALVAELTAALDGPFREGYETLLATLDPLVAKAGEDDGVWRLPDGLAYYDHRIRRFTTRSAPAEEVHAFGLEEVRRIHGEVEEIRRKVGFDGDLKGFLAYLRDDARFRFPDTDEGRAEYIALSHGYIEAMKARLDRMFITLPKAGMEIRRVEPFRERSSARAFYDGPPGDGSRGGIYFINLFNMEEHRRHGVETLAYHEGIPGHHMQIAIAQELTGLPRFRRFGGYSAYAEGWALYTEKMVKAFGAFTDPYSDYGRLEGELFRAIRLVVDTGIHARRWTRRQAIDFMTANSAIPEPRAVREIERYIGNPGQALAYKMGMRTIEDLRTRAESDLGDRFDLRRFHDAVLTGGSLPLTVLEDRIDGWIAAERA